MLVLQKTATSVLDLAVVSRKSKSPVDCTYWAVRMISGYRVFQLFSTAVHQNKKMKPSSDGFVFCLRRSRSDTNAQKAFEPPQKGVRVHRLHIVQFCKVSEANPPGAPRIQTNHIAGCNQNVDNIYTCYQQYRHQNHMTTPFANHQFCQIL